MKINVADYENILVNGGPGRSSTYSCSLVNVKTDSGLGGVDHSMKGSVKSIVDSYVRRLKRDGDYGFPGAEYVIEIVLCNSARSKIIKTINIPVKVE